MSLGVFVQPPLVLTGAQVAFWVGLPGVFGTNPPSPPSFEMPAIKIEVTKGSDKTESTGSTSVVAGAVWKDYGKGPSNWSMNVDGCWRIGSPVNIPAFQQGLVYPIAAFVRRPGWSGIADIGSAYFGALFIDSNTTTFDPRSGIVSWRLAGTGQTNLLDPV